MNEGRPEVSVNGWRCRLLKARLWIRMFRIALDGFGFAGGITSLSRLNRIIDRARAGRTLPRCVHVGRRLGWDLFAPAFPSAAFDRFAGRELSRALGQRSPWSSRATASRRGIPNGRESYLQTAFIGITNSCSLRCRHCSAWDSRGEPDALTAADIGRLVGDLARRGVTQIFFTGGEPMRRLEAMLDAAAPHATSIDFWVFTSGAGLTQDAAARLRSAGFTGVAVSVDDWRPAAHDAFRGTSGSFETAIAASRAVRDSGLALAWTLCPSREFVSVENLSEYLSLAERLGASFVQFMEPKAVGRYAGRDVALGGRLVRALEEFTAARNFDPLGRGPLIAYPDLAQSRLGCTGAAQRYVYVATDGEVHPSPLCRASEGNVRMEDVNLIIDRMEARGCRAVMCPARAGPRPMFVPA